MKIVFLSDFVKVGIGERYFRNILNGVEKLFQYQIQQATGSEIINIYDILSVDKFLQLNSKEKISFKSSKHKWAYHINNISQEAEDYFVGCLKDTVVIGYHLPKLMIDILNKHNIPFFDLFETSYRYMQDCFIGIRTNVPKARDHLINYAISDHSMYAYANYMKGFYANIDYKLDDNSCLLIGQTPYDIVVINETGDGFVSLVDYKDQILFLSKKYQTVYYKEHPLYPLSKEVKKYLNSLSNIKKTKANIYCLLSKDNIKEVVALNSGVVYEAKYFGKKHSFLYKKYHEYYQDGADINNYSTYVILKSNSYIFKINFWADLFDTLMPVRRVMEKDDVKFENYQDIFSLHIRASSSYPFFLYTSYYLKNERLRVKMKIRKLFVNFFLIFIPSKRIKKILRDKYIINDF